MWHVTPDNWHVTCDTWHSQAPQLFRFGIDSVMKILNTKDYLMNEIMNHKAVYRKAPATPGLLIRCGKVMQSELTLVFKFIIAKAMYFVKFCCFGIFIWKFSICMVIFISTLTLPTPGTKWLWPETDGLSPRAILRDTRSPCHLWDTGAQVSWQHFYPSTVTQLESNLGVGTGEREGVGYKGGGGRRRTWRRGRTRTTTGKRTKTRTRTTKA